MPEPRRPATWPLLLFLCAPLWAQGPSLTPLVSVTVDSERLEYEHEGQKVRAQGETEIRVEVEGKPEQRALVETRNAQADLAENLIEASEGVDLIVPRAWFSGESLRLDAAHQLFSLQAPTVVFDLNDDPDEPPVLAQFRGRELEGAPGRWTIRSATLAPSSEDRPPVALRARRLDFDPDRGVVKIQGGSVNLLGLNVPLLVDVRVRVRPRRHTLPLLPFPRYSSRAGVILPYVYEFTEDDRDLQSTLALQLTSRRGIGFISRTSVEGRRWEAAMDLGHKEEGTSRLSRDLLYDRLPHLTLRGYEHHAGQDSGWRAVASAGQFSERDGSDPLREEISRTRSELEIAYGWGARAQDRGLGRWGDVRLRSLFYSQGEQFNDIVLSLGAGTRLGGWGRAGLTAVHHLTSGSSPLQYDEVEIKSELQPELDLWVGGPWGLRTRGRYDMERSDLRDYYLELRYRTTVLTWGLYYNHASTSFGIKVDINGLTGDTAPPPITGELGRRYLEAQERFRTAPWTPAP